MTRIVLVGAGSVEFTRNLLGDIPSYEALRDAEIVLHDIDADRLSTAEQMARWTAGALGASPRIEAHLDRRDALKGADFVIDTIQVGGAAATQIDFEIPRRFGLEYTINDTINVGGVFRGLRSIPVILGIVRDMEELCPDAWFLNYTNPMSMIIWAVTSQSSIKTVGLCHSVHWTVHAISEFIDARYTFLNEMLASYYGIGGVAGPEAGSARPSLWRAAKGMRATARTAWRMASDCVAKRTGSSA